MGTMGTCDIKYWSIYVHMIWEFVTNTHGLRLKMGTTKLSNCHTRIAWRLRVPSDDSQTEMPSTISSKTIVRQFPEYFHEFRGWHKFISE